MQTELTFPPKARRSSAEISYFHSQSTEVCSLQRRNELISIISELARSLGGMRADLVRHNYSGGLLWVITAVARHSAIDRRIVWIKTAPHWKLLDWALSFKKERWSKKLCTACMNCFCRILPQSCFDYLCSRLRCITYVFKDVFIRFCFIYVVEVWLSVWQSEVVSL